MANMDREERLEKILSNVLYRCRACPSLYSKVEQALGCCKNVTPNFKIKITTNKSEENEKKSEGIEKNTKVIVKNTKIIVKKSENVEIKSKENEKKSEQNEKKIIVNEKKSEQNEENIMVNEKKSKQNEENIMVNEKKSEQNEKNTTANEKKSTDEGNESKVNENFSDEEDENFSDEEDEIYSDEDEEIFSDEDENKSKVNKNGSKVNEINSKDDENISKDENKSKENDKISKDNENNSEETENRSKLDGQFSENAENISKDEEKSEEDKNKCDNDDSNSEKDDSIRKTKEDNNKCEHNYSNSEKDDSNSEKDDRIRKTKADENKCENDRKPKENEKPVLVNQDLSDHDDELTDSAEEMMSSEEEVDEEGELDEEEGELDEEEEELDEEEAEEHGRHGSEEDTEKHDQIPTLKELTIQGGSNNKNPGQVVSSSSLGRGGVRDQIWRRKDIDLLIQMVQDNYEKIQATRGKNSVWLDIVAKLSKNNSNITLERVNSKWYNIRNQFKNYQTGRRLKRPWWYDTVKSFYQNERTNLHELDKTRMPKYNTAQPRQPANERITSKVKLPGTEEYIAHTKLQDKKITIAQIPQTYDQVPQPVRLTKLVGGGVIQSPQSNNRGVLSLNGKMYMPMWSQKVGVQGSDARSPPSKRQRVEISSGIDVDINNLQASDRILLGVLEEMRRHNIALENHNSLSRIKFDSVISLLERKNALLSDIVERESKY